MFVKRLREEFRDDMRYLNAFRKEYEIGSSLDCPYIARYVRMDDYSIVEEFIDKGEPVGSKALMVKYRLPYSSATIRNEMAELEKIGFLEKTHSSSGRVPSTEGYKYYVDNIMN